MGNLLEAVNLDNYNLGDRKPQKDENESHFYLSESEKAHLWTHFNEIFAKSKQDSSAGQAAVFIPVKEAFVKTLSHNYHAHLAEIVFDYLAAKRTQSYTSFELFVIDSTRISSSRSLEMLYDIAHYGSNSHPLLVERTQLGRICYMVYLLALGPISISDGEIFSESVRLEEFYVNAHLKMHGKNNADMSLNEFIAITQAYFPHTAKAFQSYFCIQLLHSEESPSYHPFTPLVLPKGGEAGAFPPSLLVYFSLHAEALQGRWKRLYSSATDGLSFNRVVHHILGYDGPTCFLIRCNNPEHSVFGFFCNSRWKETNRFYGSSSNILFTITPNLRIFRSKQPSDSHYQWLNSKAYALPHGLGIGGTLEGFRVFIPESLEGCTANQSCPTFEAGPLLPSGERFELDVMEVWAVGGQEKVTQGLKAQAQERAMARENIDKARKVDKAAFFNNAFDQEFLLSGTMSHKQYQTMEDEKEFTEQHTKK